MRKSSVQRFWEKVDKTNECWLWKAATDGWGYGHMWWPDAGRVVKAHRLAYELLVGPIPKGLHIDHLCRRRSCVRPDHLEPVTQQTNWNRGQGGENLAVLWAARRAVTHCPQGHPYDEANTRYVQKKDQQAPERLCRECGRQWDRTRRSRRQSARLTPS